MSDEPASSKTQSQMVSRDTRKRHQEGLYTVKTFKYFRESKYFLIFLAATTLFPCCYLTFQWLNIRESSWNSETNIRVARSFLSDFKESAL